MGTLIAIDAQNLYYSARRNYDGRVDFQKLWDHLQEQEEESFSIVYLVRGSDYDSSGFENLLRGIGYRISPRRAVRAFDGHRSRIKYDSHQIRISMDAAVRFTDRYSKFILISGDVDYSDLCAELRHMGKATEFWSFDSTLSPDLISSVDKVRFMGAEFLQDG